MLLFCHGVAFGLPLQVCVCVREGLRAGENTCECFCASRECVRGVTEREKGDNYIILWIRGVRRVIEAPLADGCTCNPAVMRQCWDHTPHTLSPIMYIINATACGKKKYIKKTLFPSVSALPTTSADIIYQRRRSYQKPKVRSKCRLQPTEKIGPCHYFWYRNPARDYTFHRHKKWAFFISFYLENHTQDGQWEWRQPWPCYFCSSFRKQQAFHLGDARKKYAPLWQEKSHSVMYEEEWTNETFRREAHQNPAGKSPP